MHLLKFKPIYQTRVWGGRSFETALGRQLPGTEPIGESWEIVDRPEAQSVDSATGNTLRADGGRIRSHHGPGLRPQAALSRAGQMAGLQPTTEPPGPLPPKAVAEKLGGEPKTECWYIANSEPGAALIVGLKPDISRTQFEQAIAEEALEPLLHRFDVSDGQAMLLESGRLHAIDAGNLILEIQQNSDTTYRVYDWGRVGLDGKPRDLHVTESLQSIDFNDIEPDPQPTFTQRGQRTIADCKEFRIRQINLKEGEELSFEANEQPRVLSLVTGCLSEASREQQLNAAENILVPYSHATRLKATTSSTVLVTDQFI